MIDISNIFSTGVKVAQNYISKKHKPVNVMLSLTNRCNGNCIYCSIPERVTKELSTKEFFLLIDELKKTGIKRLGLWGGEPLIRKDISDIVNYAKDKDIFITMDSNGYLVPDKFDVIKNLDHLMIGFDGDMRIHDLHRGRGSHKRVIEALKCVKNNVPTWTITVLTKHNLGSIDYILKTADELNFLTTFQVLHHNDVLSANFKNLLPKNEKYKKTISKLIQYKKRGAPIASSLKYLQYILKWPDYRKNTLTFPVGGLKCKAGKFFCNIDSNGDLYPCSLLVKKMKSKNILTDGFSNAFNNINNFSCKACDASCYIEYNYLYNLDFFVIYDWLSSFYLTRKFIREKK